MSDDVKLVITGTFGLLTLAWVLVHATDVNTVTTGIASSYKTAVDALRPT